MKSSEEMAKNLLERRDRYLVEQQRKRKRFLQLSVSLGCFCLVAMISMALNFVPSLLNRDNPKNQEQSHISVVDSDSNIIYAADDYSGIQMFEMKDKKNYLDNISDNLKKELKKNRSNTLYSIIIVGNSFSGKEFSKFRYEGFTYYEYENLLRNAMNKLSQEIEKGTPEEQYKIIEENIKSYNRKMETLVNEYNEYYVKTQGSVFNYLKKHYSFVSYQEPADFNEINLEDYQMLSVSSHDTIIALARDNFQIYLAPKTQKRNITLHREGVFLEKLSARAWRDMMRGDTIKAYVSIKTDEQAPSYIYEEKTKLMNKYGITDYFFENSSVLPYVQCSLTADQIRNLVNDSIVENISNVCDLGYHKKIQRYQDE